MLAVHHQQLLELAPQLLRSLRGGAETPKVVGNLDLETDVTLALGDVPPRHLEIGFHRAHDMGLAPIGRRHQGFFRCTHFRGRNLICFVARRPGRADSCRP